MNQHHKMVWHPKPLVLWKLLTGLKHLYSVVPHFPFRLWRILFPNEMQNLPLFIHFFSLYSTMSFSPCVKSAVFLVISWLTQTERPFKLLRKSLQVCGVNWLITVKNLAFPFFTILNFWKYHFFIYITCNP